MHQEDVVPVMYQKDILENIVKCLANSRTIFHSLGQDCLLVSLGRSLHVRLPNCEMKTK